MADCVLVFTLLEALALIRLRRRTGLSTADVAGLLLPGAALSAALWLALAGVGIAAIGAALLAALAGHAFDLNRRIQAARK